MSNFEQFQDDFFNVFNNQNFYEGKTYLEYIAEPQTNDEDNIVDTKIVLPLLTALGFDSGDIAKNTTSNGKDSSRPDFQIKLASGNIRCFLIEDKHTAYNIQKSEPLQQLISYAPSRGYDLGLLCNGKLLLGWDISNPSSPVSVLHLDIEKIIQTYDENGGISGLTSQQIQDLKGLYRRFNKDNFANIETLIQDIGRPENQWFNDSFSQHNTPNFDELLILDIKAAILLLEEDVLYQLQLLIEEYEQYCQAKYLPNGNGINKSNNIGEKETTTKILERLRSQILNYLRVYGVLEVEEFSDIVEKLIEFADKPQGSIQEIEQIFLNKLINGQNRKLAQKNQQSTQVVQLDLIPTISETKKQELGIKVTEEKKITKLDSKLVEILREYERIVFDWKAWQAKQDLTHDHAIKTYQYFISWRNLVSKTILQGADDDKLKAEFARQTAYVYVIRLLMVRICEDKKLINRKFSNGGFKYWKEEVEPRYLDLAQGMSMDYLLEMSYRSAQNIYAHFFNSADLFNWYRINSNTLIKVLHILNRFNLQEIDSDIIGMVYGRYVEEGKHEQGRYFTPKEVVEYILDAIGYKSDNPDIRDQKLLDPAGGSGSFLVHAARRLINSYRSRKTNKIPVEYVPAIIQQVKDCLFCLDINPFACYLAETNLLIQVVDLLHQAKEVGKLQECTIDRFNVYNTDSLLLPKLQEIRTPLLNPILDLELSTVAQIKTKSGKFIDGFDFVVGNPPYVKADEPGQLSYRQLIISQGRFETLYKKWDLFIAFIELSQQLLKQETGTLGLIVSDAFSVATYGEKSREMLYKKMQIQQIDFFEDLKLFADAAVFNVVFIAKNKSPQLETIINRYWHNSLQNLYSFSKTDIIHQIQSGERIFRHGEVTLDFSNTILLDDIVYISKGMVLNCHETKYPHEFVKDDLISDIQDETHPVKYIEGKDIDNYQVNRIRYLEFGPGLRSPKKVSRPTFPELYIYEHIAIGKTGGVTIVDGGIYSNDSVRVLLNWYLLDGVNSRSVPMDKIEQNKELSKQFSLQYLAAILTSSVIQRFFDSISTGTRSDIMPDDLRKIPIKSISLTAQQPFIDCVNDLITWNWQLYELTQLGHEIKFDSSDKEPIIKVNFLQVFKNLIETVNLPCWNFLNAEPHRFEIIGERDQPITKIKIKDDKMFNGRQELIFSESTIVLQFLQIYLQQYEKRGLTWTNLIQEGKIPKTDEHIQQIFDQCTCLQAEINDRILDIRSTYRKLDEMIDELYSSSI
ncbi:MAG: Eco57I restriction-modification methylase domain-containing protein [Cuspidothrix sp.]